MGYYMISARVCDSATSACCVYMFVPLAMSQNRIRPSQGHMPKHRQNATPQTSTTTRATFLSSSTKHVSLSTPIPLKCDLIVQHADCLDTLHMQRLYMYREDSKKKL